MAYATRIEHLEIAKGLKPRPRSDAAQVLVSVLEAQ